MSNNSQFKLTKKIIDDTMYNVVLPFYSTQYFKDTIKKSIDDGKDPKAVKKTIAMIALSLSMPSVERAINFTKRAISILKRDGLDIERFVDKVPKIFYIHKNYIITQDFYEEKLYKEIVKAVSGMINDELNVFIDCDKEYNESDFLDFDFSDDRDKLIDSMHYKECEKIDAKTFFENNEIEEDIIDELNDELSTLRDIVNFNVTLTPEYIETYKSVLLKFIKIFSFLSEFKDLNIAFESLYGFLDSITIEGDKDSYSILKELLDSIYLDLEKWMKEVILEKSTRDIHYLDAALLANIEQLMILFNSTKEKNKEDEDDEFELF